MTPDLDRSVRVLQAAGLDLRRIREEPTAAGAPRQAFFRLGAEILEVVQEPAQVVAERGGEPARPARLWGLALLAADLDASVAALGAARRRACATPCSRDGASSTLKRSAGLAVPVALMSPRSRLGASERSAGGALGCGRSAAMRAASSPPRNGASAMYVADGASSGSSREPARRARSAGTGRTGRRRSPRSSTAGRG